MREDRPVGRFLAKVTAVTLLVLGGCASDGSTEVPSDADGLRIASFDFAESEVLAEVYAQAAEAVGVPVVRLGAVGPREVVVPAMRNDAVDLVPEYLGSALLFAEVDSLPADVEDATSTLGDRLDEYEIAVLRPSGAVDSNVFVVTASTAEAYGLVSVSDLAAAPLNRLGGPAECVDRPLCLIGLRDTYAVTFDEFVTQPSLLFTAESLRQGEIDVGVMFSTAPELDADDLVALIDDRGLQPPENVVPIVRRSALARWGPELSAALDAVSAQLTTEQLRRLNARVAEGESTTDLARDWLDSSR